MKLARFIGPGGRQMTGRVVDAQRAAPLVGELFGKLEFASDTVEMTTLLPPVDPPNIFAIGRNYLGHVQETGARLPEKPLVFMKATTALLAPEGAVVLPAAAPDEVDFEAELAIVIGRRACRVSERDALEHVLGYTCANDVTARDCQRNDKQWTRAKGFDTFCPLGPWLVTADEFDPQDCRIGSRVNGELMQDDTTAQMIFTCSQLVSFLSHQFTLLPGTVILTGTPEGVGFTRQPPVFLRSGDRVDVEIEGIGTLSNPVVGVAG